MDRRSLLIRAAAVSALATLGTGARALAASALRLVRPGEAGWPSDAAWEGLRRTVGGNLLKPVSPYAACQTGPTPACRESLKLLHDPYYLGDQPGGTQVSGWLDAWTPKLSAYAVAARGAADVAAAVNFAREHRLRLVVKGGGHSYQGTSNAADSLLIWTRAMNAVELHDAFVAKDCAGFQTPEPAVSIGAGAVWMDAYDAVTTRAGRYVQGGGCTTVGVAGHIQSGGYGSHSKGFGTASANLLEAEIVTADGAVRIVNPRRDADLFWALKGGGGGSFGVVTRVTVRTHTLPDRFGWAEGLIRASSDAAYRRLIERFMGFYSEALFNPQWGEQASVRPDNLLKINMVSQGLDAAGAKRVWRPFIDWVSASPQDFSFVEAMEIGAIDARGWWDAEGRRRRGSTSMTADERPGAPAAHAWWKGDQDQVSAFLHGYNSLWMPADLLAPARRADLADALFAASRHIDVGLHFNKGLAGAPAEALARAADTATNPGALTAFALAIVATGGPPPSSVLAVSSLDVAKAKANAAAVDRAAAALREAAPGAGSYVSESNYFNASWREAFWGPNYPRLRRVKARYDPQGRFYVRHGVGSEDWDEGGFRRRV